jgi:hypothetical protein
MVNDFQNIKQQYIDSATLNSKAKAEGNYKVANKQAKINLKIIQRIQAGKADINILLELLNYEYIGVSTLAAIDLLRFRHETQKAVEKLEKIAAMDETYMGVDERLSVMAAQIQLKSWKEKGYVT